MRRLARDVLIGLAAVALAATLLRSSYLLDVAAYAAVLALFALGVAVTFGQLGYVSFGHAAFLGLGAYAAGLMVTRLGWNYWLVLPLAVVPGVLLGALLGVASARLSGAYFAIATLVVAEVLVLLFVHWADFTGGPMGLMVVLPDPPGARAIGWNAQQGYLFVVGAALVLTFLLLRKPARQRHGPQLDGDPRGACAGGIAGHRHGAVARGQRRALGRPLGAGRGADRAQGAGAVARAVRRAVFGHRHPGGRARRQGHAARPRCSAARCSPSCRKGCASSAS